MQRMVKVPGNTAERKLMTCGKCEQILGYHSLRQIGIDEAGRPVMYMCCSQSSCDSDEPYKETCWQDHLQHLNDSAIYRAEKDWIWIIDVRTKRGEEYSKWKHGPDAMVSVAQAKGINIHQLVVIFEDGQSNWKDVHLRRDRGGIKWDNTAVHIPSTILMAPFRESDLDLSLSDEIKTWLKNETNCNRSNTTNVEFWYPTGDHDSRGVASFVNQHIRPWLKAKKKSQKGHPHPTIVKFYEDHKYESNGGVISDSHGNRDALNYQDYAEKLSAVLRDEKLSLPVTVGIQGSWGVGKTFLLNLLGENLKNSEAEPKRSSCLGQEDGRRSSICIFFCLSFVLTFLVTAAALTVMITAHVFLPGNQANVTNNTTENAKFKEFVIEENVPLVTYLSAVCLLIAIFTICSLYYCLGDLARGSFHRSLISLQEFLLMLFTIPPNNLYPRVGDTPLEPHMIQVKFNAWEYAGSDFLWAGIITHLCDQIELSFGLWTTRCFRLIQHDVGSGQSIQDAQNGRHTIVCVPAAENEPKGKTRRKKKDGNGTDGTTAPCLPKSEIIQNKDRAETLLLRRTCCIPSFLFLWLCTGFLLISIAIIIIFATSSTSDDNGTINVAIEAIFGTFLSLTVLYKFKVGIYVVKALWRSQKSRIEQLQHRLTRSNFDEELGFMHRVKKEVELVTKLVHYLQWLHNKIYRVVIQVDDLDRCEEKKIVKILEAVNILLSDPNSSFISVLAVDPRLIVKSIEHSYGDRLSEAYVSGYEYLKKIITLPLSISPANKEDTENLITSYLEKIKSEGIPDSGSVGGKPAQSKEEDTEPNNKSESIASLQPTAAVAGQSFPLDVVDAGQADIEAPADQWPVQYQNCLEFALESLKKDDISRWLNSNPRSIKRITNILNLVLKLYVAELRDITEVDLKKKIHKLTGWIVFTEQWPYRASRFIHHFKTCNTQENGHDGLSAQSLFDVWRDVEDQYPHPNSWKSLLNLDCNPKHLIAFLKCHRFTFHDLEHFSPYTVNIDHSLEQLVSASAQERQVESKMAALQPEEVGIAFAQFLQHQQAQGATA